MECIASSLGTRSTEEIRSRLSSCSYGRASSVGRRALRHGDDIGRRVGRGVISSYGQDTTPRLPFLFLGGVGKTWDDPDRVTSLYSGVVREIFDALPDEAWVYPGHGADTTLGAERPHLIEWRERGW